MHGYLVLHGTNYLELAQSRATGKEDTVVDGAVTSEYQVLELVEVASGRQANVEPVDEQSDRGGAFEYWHLD